MEPVAPYEPAVEAPVYWECPACGFLSLDPTFADATSTCPSCSEVGGERRRFPPEGQVRLDARIRTYYREREWEIAVILAAALLEALLEDILDRIMATHGADVPMRGTLLDTVRAIGQRISRLFPDLTGAEFEDAAAKLGFRDFPKRWRQVRETRNAFIHDTPYREEAAALDEQAAASAMRLLDEAYRLFVSINNEYVANGGAHASDIPRISLHGEAVREAPAREASEQ
jgi:hypothetical protein